MEKFLPGSRKSIASVGSNAKAGTPDNTPSSPYYKHTIMYLLNTYYYVFSQQ